MISRTTMKHLAFRCVVAIIMAACLLPGLASAQFMRLDSFNPNANHQVGVLAEQPDGKILVGGSFSEIAGSSRSQLARLHPDGSLDTSFVGSTINASVYDIAVLPDGKLLIIGPFAVVGGHSYSGIARLHSDGTVDTTFPNHSVVPSWEGIGTSRVLLLSDGKILVAGSFMNIGNSGRSGLARLHPDGQIDTSFTFPGSSGQGNGINAMAELDDGRLLIGGNFTHVAGSPRDNLVRLHTNGSVDTSFDGRVRLSTGWANVSSIIVQSDGRIVVGGLFDQALSAGSSVVTVGNLVRFQSNGALDFSFIAQGGSTNGRVSSIVLRGDQGLVIGGEFTQTGTIAPATPTHRTHLAWLEPDGSATPHANVNWSFAGGSVRALLRTKLGKVILGGSFTKINGVARNRLAGVTSDAPRRPLSDIVAIFAGGMSGSTCARTHAGTVKCWGANGAGKLGEGTENAHPMAVDAHLLGSGITHMDVGRYTACATYDSGNARCWGAGPLGDGSTGQSFAPVQVSGLAGITQAIASGHSHHCALTTNGQVRCWGVNNTGQLGDGTTNQRLTPVNVVGLDEEIQAISVGHHTSCALTITGKVKCWGARSLGSGSSSTPVDVPGLSAGVRQISVGVGFSCALTDSGGVLCWGSNQYGQLGIGSYNTSLVPVQVNGLTSGIQQVATSRSWFDSPQHACALTNAGTVKCWGKNHLTGSPSQHTAPVDIPGVPTDFLSIAAGPEHTCGLRANGHVFCWGVPDRQVLGGITLPPGFAHVIRPAYSITASADTGGSLAGHPDEFLDPDATPQFVDPGKSARLVALPDTGYSVADVGGTCGGSLAGNVFTTDAMVADCTVEASFELNTWTVTPSVSGGNGSIAPATAQTVNHGSSTSFTLSPATGYHVAQVTGSCGGSLAGNVFTTSAITAHCTVIGHFANVDLSVSVSNQRDYLRYGMTTNYVVSITNHGNTTASGIAITSTVPTQIDGGAASWVCLEPGVGVVCTPAGSGMLNTSGISIPAGRSVHWLVTAPVRNDATGATVDYAVSVSGALLPQPVAASDSDALVLFRNGFNNEYDDGANPMLPPNR